MKLLSAADRPTLLALGTEWKKLNDACSRGAGDGIDDQISRLVKRTQDFLREKLDDNHAAMFMNEPPEHIEIAGRGTRDKYLIGLTGAKLKKVNQIIEEQRKQRWSANVSLYALRLVAYPFFVLFVQA